MTSTLTRLREAIEGMQHTWDRKRWGGGHSDDCRKCKIMAALDALEAELRENRIPERIQQWAQAYPLDIFPEPSKEDWKEADKLLREAGMSVDRFSASNMRHVITRVVEILEGK